MLAPSCRDRELQNGCTGNVANVEQKTGFILVICLFLFHHNKLCPETRGLKLSLAWHKFTCFIGNPENVVSE